MAVPNTSTFSLKNVVSEINPFTDDLLSCFAASTDSGFISSYKGNKDRLTNFRGYSDSGY